MTVVQGTRGLPSGYPQPHASELARSIAENGMILRVQVGSGVHGTSIDSPTVPGCTALTPATGRGWRIPVPE